MVSQGLDYQFLHSRRPGAVCLWSSSSLSFPFGGGFHIHKTTQEMHVRYYHLGTSEKS